MRAVSRGQGSLEYLLLIGAGALVALLAFLLLLFLGPYGGLLFEQNVEEYNKIDLCTASDNAACSLFLNWNDGLSTPPNGFVLKNTSSWRTLQVDGIAFKIFCTDGLCDGGEFYSGQGPTITLEFPIDDLGNYCDPAPSTSTCRTVDFYMCELEGVDFTGECSTSFDFSEWHNAHPTQPDVTFALSPDFPAKEVVIASVGNLNNKSLKSVQFIMKVSQVDDDGISTFNEGWDTKAEELSWYSTNPYLFSSSFQCMNLEQNPPADHVEFGCVFPPNCIVTFCPASVTSPLPGSIEEACSNFGLFEGEALCSTGTGYVEAECMGVAAPYFTHSTGLSPKGAFVSMDISSMKGAVFLENFKPVLSVSVHDFDALYHDVCEDDFLDNDLLDGDCQTVCENFAPQFEDLHFYLLNPSPAPVNPLNMCSALSNAALPAALDFGATPLNDLPPFPTAFDKDSGDGVDNQYSCLQSFDFSGTFVSSVLNAATTPDVIYIGARYPNPPPSAHTFFTISPFLASGSFSMGAFYYSG